MNREELVNDIQRNAKKLNKRFERLEELGIGLNESAYRYSQAELNQDTPRFEYRKKELNKLSNQDLRELDRSIEKKLESKSSTISGIKEINEKRISNAVYSLNKKLGLEGKEAITEKSFKAFIETGGSDLLNNPKLSSTQVIEDWLDLTKKGIKKNDFIKLFNEYSKKHTTNKGKINLGKIRKEFDIELKKPGSIHVRKNKQVKLKKNKKTSNVSSTYRKKKKKK